MLNQAPAEDPKLPVHEWMAVVVILMLISGLSVLVIISGNSENTPAVSSPHYIVEQEIEISVEGAVEKSGTFHVNRGTTVSQVLQLAVPTSEADLRSIKQDKKVRKRQVIKVPRLIIITVRLEGAVEAPGPITFPKGTRLNELINKVKFKQGANIEKLRKKRLLKDGEIITVSFVNGVD